MAITLPLYPNYLAVTLRAKSLDELMSRIREAILLYLETEGGSTSSSFVGVKVVEVETC